MALIVLPGPREFHLTNGRISLILAVLADGTLGQLHWGGALDPGPSYRHLDRCEFRGFGPDSAASVLVEYPTGGRGDFRAPALVVRHPDGSTAVDLKFADHTRNRGKPPLEGFLSTYVEDLDEAETLEIRLRDGCSGLEVTLSYTIWAHRDVVCRHAVFTNRGTGDLVLTTALSLSLDLPDADWTLVQLSGAWARERRVVERPLAPGFQGVSSHRGASGHQHNPFLALRRPWTTEGHGEALGISLVYSGNFLAEAEVSDQGTTRLRTGISPSDFGWVLGPGQRFTTPEALLAYSREGLGALSRTFHSLLGERLVRGPWRDRPRPLLINHWEATYWDFDEARLVSLAAEAADLGIELFVVDDGWFGHRNDATSSLGDWTVNPAKLPGGLARLAERVGRLGLELGLWFEPEMVSPDSDLFRSHPEWAVGIPGRDRTLGRNQYLLDLTNPEVVDYLFAALAQVLGSAPITYVKWDRNRSVTEPWGATLGPGHQGEFFHRMVLGLYGLLERLTLAFPHILWEASAGGGGRFDPGMLAYFPQVWTSDNTDAVDRLAIQHGTSLVYPLSTMGAHVTAVPNHQVGRSTPLSMRAAVAFFGVLGYELDPGTLSPDEKNAVRDQIRFARQHREVLTRGRFYRLTSPFADRSSGADWLCVAPDGSKALVGHFEVLNPVLQGYRRLRLEGLAPQRLYRVSVWPTRHDAVARENSGVRRGGELMTVGLLLGGDSFAYNNGSGDFSGTVFVLEATDVANPAGV